MSAVKKKTLDSACVGSQKKLTLMTNNEFNWAVKELGQCVCLIAGSQTKFDRPRLCTDILPFALERTLQVFCNSIMSNVAEERMYPFPI